MTCPFTMSAQIQALKLGVLMTSTANGMAHGMLATERKTPVRAAANILCASLITALNQAAAISAPVLDLAPAAPTGITANGVALITGVWG